MNALFVSLAALVIILAGAGAGLMLCAFLPDHHLTDETKIAIKAARNVIVGLTALTLGLLVASAKNSFDDKENELRIVAAKTITLDHLLRKLGPKADQSRELLRQAARNGILSIEKTNAGEIDPKRAATNIGIDELQTALLAIKTTNDAETWVKTSALSLSRDLALSRWKLYQGMNGSIAWQLIAILVFWITSIFFSFGFITPRNALALGGLFVAALSMAGAIYLTLELDQPFGGFMEMSESSLQLALQELNRE